MAKTSLKIKPKTKTVTSLTKEVSTLKTKLEKLVKSIDLLPQELILPKKIKSKVKRGRPIRKTNGEKSTKLITFSLAPSEFELIELKRHSKQMNRSKYIRECIGINE